VLGRANEELAEFRVEREDVERVVAVKDGVDRPMSLCLFLDPR